MSKGVEVLMIHKIEIEHIKVLGCFASMTSIILWITLIWIDPYFEGMNKVNPIISFIMLVCPALLFLLGLFQLRSMLMLISFVWSIPYSLFMLLTLSIFMLFGVTSFIYFICIVLFRLKGIKYYHLNL